MKKKGEGVVVKIRNNKDIRDFLEGCDLPDGDKEVIFALREASPDFMRMLEMYVQFRILHVLEDLRKR